MSERHVPPLTPKKVAQLGRFDHHGFAQDWVLQQGTIAYPVQPPHLSPMSHSQAALTFSPSRHANFTGTPEPPSRDAALIIHVDNTAGKTAKKPASSAGGRGAVGKAEEKKRNRRLAAAMRKRNTSSLQEPGSDPAAHRLVRDLPNARELSSPLLRPRGQLDKDGKGQIQARDKANHDPHQRDAPRTAARKPSGSKEQGSRRQYRSGRSQLIELEDDKAAAAKRECSRTGGFAGHLSALLSRLSEAANTQAVCWDFTRCRGAQESSP